MRPRHRLGTAIATCVVLIGAEAALYACPVCFQVEAGPVVDGVRAAVLVLVGVTAVVLGAFGRFAWRLATSEVTGRPHHRAEPGSHPERTPS